MRLEERGSRVESRGCEVGILTVRVGVGVGAGGNRRGEMRLSNKGQAGSGEHVLCTRRVIVRMLHAPTETKSSCSDLVE